MIKNIADLVGTKISNFISFFLVGVIILMSLGFLLSTALQESPIMDELAHIPSGYSYDKLLDYRLNPEHPPLVKALAAIPLLFENLKFPTDTKYWTEYINGQWDMGNSFIYKDNDGNADNIVFSSRIFPIILTLILILFVYFWSRELMGPWWALIPTFLAGLSPNILAHGHYVTTDLGAALGFFIGLYFFVKALTKPSVKSIILAGIFFGLAELLKFSTVLLVPIFIIMILAYWIAGQNRSFKNLWVMARNFILIMIIGYVIVGAVYFLFTLNYPVERQFADTRNILTSFAGGERLHTCLPVPSLRCLATIDLTLSKTPVLRGMGQYMLGVLMVMQRSSGGNTAYFLGNVSAGGWWYYFPIVFLLKEPIPSLILIFLGLLLALGRMRWRQGTVWSAVKNYVSLNFAEFSMALVVVFYWLYSIKSPLNIGFRHILPTIPFMYILASISMKKWISGNKLSVSSSAKEIFKKYLKIIVLAFCLVWFLIEVLISYPYFLSYFNEFGGGIWGGYRYVTDSNYDWGQDLLRLKNFVNDPANGVDKIAIDYFGGGDTNYYLGDKGVNWNSAKGNPLDSGIKWLAVSVNSLMSAKANPVNFERKQEDSYQWLNNWQTPYARAGTSIFIYRLK